MIRSLALAGLLLAALPAIGKPRVASINMCTDQLLLALADPGQIVGISHLAHDADLSFFWRKAKGHRTLSGQAEDVLPLRPDLVLTATFVRANTRGLLAAQGQAIAEFASAATVGEVKAQITRAGALLHQPDRASEANARIDSALARLQATAKARAGLAVLPLERRGWISGRDSLLTALLTEAGVRNIGAERFGDGARLPLETIVTLRPDVLLVSQDNARAEDQGTALLQHRALRALDTSHRIALPHQLTVCAGPMLADALDQLAAELSRILPSLQHRK